MAITLNVILIAYFLGRLCGSLSPYIVWKRLGLLGDTVAHASLFVVAFALLLGIESSYVIIPFSIAIGLLLSYAQEKKFFELDSVLAVFFAGFMGLGLITMTLSGEDSEEILHVLFGDIEKTSTLDILILFALNTFVFFYLQKFEKQLQLMLLDQDLAKIEGINVKKHSTFLLVICSLTVGVCLKMMGVVLVTALFIAPALISLAFAKSARQHSAISTLLGSSMAVIGVLAAKFFNIPGGATIASTGLIVFLLVTVIKGR